MAWAKPKASTQARGYGYAHTQARKAWLLRHQPTDPCTRCGRPLGPAGPWLHLDHNAQRTGYIGLSHAKCNTSAGSRVGGAQARVNARRTTPHPPTPPVRHSAPPPAPSRQW